MKLMLQMVAVFSSSSSSSSSLLLFLLQKQFIRGQQKDRELAKRTVNFKRNLMYENIHAQRL